MKELSRIKNYIYGKGILSNLTISSVTGIHKGKRFVISYSKNRLAKSKNELVVEINKKRFYPKDSREIVRLLNS